MLIFNWVSPTILEVQEHLMGWTDTKITYWYYDTKKYLVNQRGQQNETPTEPMNESSIKWLHDHHLPNAKKQIAKREADQLAHQKMLTERAERFANPPATVLWLDDDMDDCTSIISRELPKAKPISISNQGIDRIFKFHKVGADGTMLSNGKNEDSARMLGERCGILTLNAAGHQHAVSQGYISS